jgi:hypothetical protein
MDDLKDRLQSAINNPPLAQLAEATVLSSVKSEFKSLREDHPIYKPPKYKVYGPYQRDDLRRHVVAYDGTNRKTISYPKFIMECKLHRLLEDNEEVHHKNEIEFDDKIDNFEIINGTKHRNMHAIEAEVFICPVCNKVFSLKGIKLSRCKSERLRKSNRKGPYCSRSCAGKENN